MGNYVDSSGTEDTLAETWNGATWTIQSTPDPTGAGGDAPAGVSCTNSTACTAVGNSQTAVNEAALAEGDAG